MNKIKLDVIGISYSPTLTGSYNLELLDKKSNRKLTIIIGGFEAQSIAYTIEGANTLRPLTHDLFVNFSNDLGVNVKEVIITKIEEGIFYSDIIFEHNGINYTLDSRTSDAVALSLKFKCPIYTSEELLDKVSLLDVEEKLEEKVSGVVLDTLLAS